MRWAIFHQLDGGWQWECRNEDGTVHRRCDGFLTYTECVEDAKRNGYHLDSSPDDAPNGV
ncbi:MAG: hypothetical protein ACXWCS_11530 [Burkholderiales bacterium]